MCESPFPLSRRLRVAPILPAPIVALDACARVVHATGSAVIFRSCLADRVLLEGDWS